MNQSLRPHPAAARPVVLILGKPLDHSLSPVMHNAAFHAVRLPWVYVPFETSLDGLAGIVRAMRGSNVMGANVTVPYKTAILPFLDRVEPEARRLGSVNTLYWEGNKLCGTSTDAEGFLRSLGPKRKHLKGSTGLLLGAGGAAKAVAGALARSGVKALLIANRNPGRAKKLARAVRQGAYRLEVRTIPWKGAGGAIPECDWVVQATSIGLRRGDPSPVSLASARPGTWVMDLIYHHETAFLKEAGKRKLARLDGRGMLLNQGALSFERWTGRKAPLTVMKSVLRAQLKSGPRRS